jgi:hypothetical protein
MKGKAVFKRQRGERATCLLVRQQEKCLVGRVVEGSIRGKVGVRLHMAFIQHQGVVWRIAPLF